MLDDHASPLQRLFNKTAQHVLDSKWTVFSQVNNWHEVLPCPDLSIQSQTPMSALVMKAVGLHKESLHEQRLKWTLWATDFFNNYKEHINRSSDTMERYLTDELAVWNKHHTEKNEQLSPEKMNREWLGTIRHLTLREFTELSIGLNAARQFLSPKFKELMDRYGMHSDENHPDAQKDEPNIINDGNSSGIATSEVNAMAVVFACVYLEKAGLFKFGTLKSNLEEHILNKYPFSYKSISSKFYRFKQDKNRLKAANTIHIERAIKILPDFGLKGSIAFAKADLVSIREK